ncbi:hypothetical protein F4779DRAFT_270064 [Xylariaceae sp. FL0662B]|nr:hypothetical protein F4779DRAFT_270064 [Xylariaceae sp. FL0662B]
MADPRYRQSGRRSPTFNPARATMPVNIGHNSHYGGDLHAVPTSRYDSTVPRRVNDHKTPSNPTATITTYNVTKDPVPRSTSHTGHTAHTARRRSSTLDTGAVKPIIVTTNHASRPHGTSSHTSSTSRVSSPSRDLYRTSDDTYYAQPASSIHSRGQNRHSSYGYGHGHSQSATLGNDEFYRLRERVGDDRLRAPVRPPTEAYRHSRPHAIYTDPSHTTTTTALVDYEDDGYEYTRPSDLARYDLDNDRQQQQRKSRRDSFDRPYYRPTVNVVTNDTGQYDSRSRRPPPTSAGLDRYNRATAAGIYDRPTVTMPALPPVPAPPLIDTTRRAAPIEGLRSPSVDHRSSRPRPVSLYQDAPTRMSHPDDLYRSRDDERVPGRRERDDGYYDDNVAVRGFGIRTDSMEQPEPSANMVARRDYDDRRTPRDVIERPAKHPSDESIDRARSHDTRDFAEDPATRVDSSRDRKDGVGRSNSISGRARDKVASGLGVAAAAIGLPPRDPSRDDAKGSPRRRDPDEEKEPAGSRTADKYKSREKDAERRSSPREDPIAIEQRRESRRDRAESTSNSRERDNERERERERERETEREIEREQRMREKGREREKERERRDRERSRRDTDAKLDGDKRDDSPQSDGSASASRRRQRPAAAFDPTDTKGLMDLKAELAAIDGQDTQKEKPTSKDQDQASGRDTAATSGSEPQPTESREESRGREVVPARDEKQVRVVSPPREKPDQRPIKGILKPPSAKFPEEKNPVREGVAPHKDDKSKKDVPPGARWTRINLKMVSPAALDLGKERYEIRDDFVIVLRVLSREEIQEYATVTAQIREARRKEYEKEFRDREHGADRDRDDEDRRSSRRHRRERDEEYDYRRDRDRDDDRERERHRRRRRGSDPEETAGHIKAIEDGGNHHHRAYRDYDSYATSSDDRR